MQFLVDETKAKGYLMVAATVPRADLEVSRKEFRALVMPGQRSLHLKDERDSRRRQIADTIARLADRGLQATVYDAGRRYASEKDRRMMCLKALVADAIRYDQTWITFDLDESLVTWDRQRMIELVRSAGAKGRLSYTHASRAAELLLAIPDAIAWCWAKGGDWRRRVEPIVSDVRRV